MTDAADIADRLRLARSANIGPVTYRQLLMRFGTAAAAIDALPALASRAGGRAPKLADPASISAEMLRVQRCGARYVGLGDADYPAMLAEIDTAPPIMTVRGDTAMLAQPCVAMVGARNASAAACRFARELAQQLANQGVTIISGLARGIDTAAHVGAMRGHTAGVIASGIDIAYPPDNADLQEKMAQDQLVIAEQPPGTEPLARHFPYRNRIIAGLSEATVIVEAAPKSGSLITARLATEFGREVLAVPGSPLDPRAQGCNQLIRDGATLIQSAADVLEALRPVGSHAFRAPGDRYAPGPATDDASDADRRAVTDLLGPTAVPVDELVRQSGLAPSAVQLILLELELAGRLDRHAAGRVALRY